MQSQPSPLVEKLIPRKGVITLFGYGISATVDHGHLILKDNIGPRHRQAVFPKIGHGLKRLTVIGSEGCVSLAALRWLADQGAAFTMLERDGSTLAVAGPIGPSDARVRRSQSLAHESGLAVEIGRELIAQKLDAQERVIRDVFQDGIVADAIVSARESLGKAKSIKAIRNVESLAAQEYWARWRSLPVNFPTADLRRVPELWRTFGTRSSPLTGSPRLAVNPLNAMLNYAYSLLETEARLAACAVGLDPGIGFLHVDTDARDSLACDIMEPVRPLVDAFFLNWITRECLKREWFFEKRDGSCRLMASLCEMLTETSLTWRHSVAPVAEQISRMLWSTIRNNKRNVLAPTHLTQSRRRYAKGTPKIKVLIPQRPPHVCLTCGGKVTLGHRYCSHCKVEVTTKALIKAAQKGRLAAHSAEAERKRAASRRMHLAAQKNWDSSLLPAWLDINAYKQGVQPRLSRLTVPAIRKALGVSKGYATNVRSGRKVPHQRHWLALAQLTQLR
ncbi:MAG TPA: CRISPR-associated endonuclease Cas1 [Candidatus Dormibacteraeota bacterium]|jgi:CRISPR-associated endonuclease Cas1|nr:CRISPR-associated endonuclease Cas1 [Candidatus Dormibacteraeota bacterium]